MKIILKNKKIFLLKLIRFNYLIGLKMHERTSTEHMRRLKSMKSDSFDLNKLSSTLSTIDYDTPPRSPVDNNEEEVETNRNISEDDENNSFRRNSSAIQPFEKDHRAKFNQLVSKNEKQAKKLEQQAFIILKLESEIEEARENIRTQGIQLEQQASNSRLQARQIENQEQLINTMKEKMDKFEVDNVELALNNQSLTEELNKLKAVSYF
jgi:hypothetical protein